MNKNITTIDIKKINEEISEIEKLLKEAVNFCEEEGMEEPEIENDFKYGDNIEEPVMDEPRKDVTSIEPYVDHIRKYSLNGLSALCDNPESEEYQMLKKIFQMCDKKPEKKEGINESHRFFGILKDSNKVIFEANIENKKDFNRFKKVIISESKMKGFNPSNIRLVSENKIII